MVNVLYFASGLFSGAALVSEEPRWIVAVMVCLGIAAVRRFAIWANS